MRKSLILAAAVVCLTAVFAGCGSGESAVTETTIDVKKNGSVVHTIVEDFTEDYYDLQGLENTIQSSCSAYNEGAGEESVTVESVSAKDGVVTVVMNYKDTSSYAGYNKQALFTGTIKDAFKAGYDLNVTLLPAGGDGAAIGKEELLGMGEKHVVIVREAVNVKVWDKILYYSEDVIPTENVKTVSVTDGNMLTYIVFD